MICLDNTRLQRHSVQSLPALLSFVAIIVLISAPVRSQSVFPLDISGNQRYLIDASGQPFLINGDTPWSLIVGLTKPEAETYLENRRQKGFNAIIVELIENYFGGPASQDGHEPFLTPGDFSTPNELYFAHADWVINTAKSKGILVVLTPAYIGYNCGEQGWCQEMKNNGVAKCLDFGRYLGQRYRDFDNIIWMNGGDADADAFGALEEVNAIAEGIGEFASQLQTAHCKRLNSGIECYDQPWLDINTTYGGTSASQTQCYPNPSEVKIDYERSPTIPFFYVEGKYEGENASPQCLRSQAYWAILGGANGQFFGNTPIWLFDPGWESAMELAGSISMGHFGALFDSRPWHDLVPDYDHSTLVSGYGNINSDSHAGAALTADGNTLIVYMPTSRTITINMDSITGSWSKGWWFDPASGDSTLIGSFPNAGARSFTPEGQGDWVLVIDSAGLNYGAPGGSPPSIPQNLDIIP